MRTRPWTWLIVVTLALAGCTTAQDVVGAADLMGDSASVTTPTSPPASSPSPTANTSTSGPSPGQSSVAATTGAPQAVATSRSTVAKAGAVRGTAVRTLTPQALTPPHTVPLPSGDSDRDSTVAQTATSAAAGRVGSLGEEREVIRLTNLARAKAGCPAVTLDATLTTVARAHSKDMAVRSYFGHDTPDGRTPFDRMEVAGYRYRTAAENIAAGQPNAETVVRDWMLSPSHRENILDCSLREIGVGLYLSGTNDYTYLWTQDFGTPM